jgi:hypothetical protein
MLNCVINYNFFSYGEVGLLDSSDADSIPKNGILRDLLRIPEWDLSLEQY